MSTKVLSAILLVCFMVSNILAQSTNTKFFREKNMQEINAISYKNSSDRFQKRDLYKNIDGSPYYYEESRVADLILHNDVVMEAVPFQIDLYADEYIATNSEGEDLYLDMKFYKEVRVQNGNQTDVFMRVHPVLTDELFHVLYQDENLVLIKKKEVKHIESSIIMSGKREFVNKFNQTTAFELIRGQVVKKISLKNKKFFKAFPKKEAAIMKEFAKENDLSLKSEQDFILLLEALSHRLSE